MVASTRVDDAPVNHARAQWWNGKTPAERKACFDGLQQLGIEPTIQEAWMRYGLAPSVSKSLAMYAFSNACNLYGNKGSDANVTGKAARALDHALGGLAMLDDDQREGFLLHVQAKIEELRAAQAAA